MSDLPDDVGDETDEDQPVVAIQGQTAPATQTTAQTFSDPFAQTEHKYGLPNGLLAAMAQTESGMRADAVSPQGAEGIMQFMPSTAREMGVDPWSVPSAIDGAGRYMKESLDRYGGDINKALMSYHGGYDERQWGPRTQAYPGAVLNNLSPDAMQPKAQEAAPDAEEKQTAQAQAQTPTSPDDILSTLNQRYGQSAAHRTVGPIPKSSAGDDILHALDQRYGGKDPATQSVQQYGPPSTPSLWHQFAHALSYGPGQLWRGLFVDTVNGWDSLINGLADAAAKDPRLALELVAPGGAASAEFAANYSGHPAALTPDPNAQSPIHLPGEQAIRTLGGLIPLTATATPAEMGDRDFGANLVSNLSRGAGWVMGAGGVVGDVNAALKGGGAVKVVGNLLKSSPVIGAATYGLGQELAHEFTGETNSAGEKEIGAALGIGLDLARVGLFHGGSALLHGGAGAYKTWVGRLISPRGILQDIVDNPAAAAANLNLPAGTEATGTTLVPGGTISRSYPEGFQVPAAVKTADQSAQALYSVLSTYDNVVNMRARALIQGNTNALLDEATRLGGGATREDAIRWLDAHNTARGDLINRRLGAAQQEADRNTAAALRDTETGPLGYNAQLIRGATIQSELIHASEDIRALAQAQYHAAEQAGVMTTPIQRDSIYDAVRAAAGQQATIGEGGQHFPWDTVRRLYKQDPRALLAEGKTEEEAFGQTNWRPDALDNVRQLNTLRSDLLDTVRDERAKWSQPGGAGDRRLIGWANQLADASRGEIERATTEAGNNQFLVNANNAFKQWNDTFNSGILGRVTSHDYQGISDLAPEQILSRFLANNDAARANVGRLYAAVKTMGAQGHPVDAIMDAYKGAVRQNFADALNARPDGGAGAQAWLASHARLFGPDAPAELQQMGQQFKAAADSAANLQTVERQSADAYKEFTGRDTNRVGAFLGADPGRELDMALRGDVKKGMQQLLNVTRNDPTGGATRGLAPMLAVRLMAQGAVPDAMAGELGTFSGRAVRDWWRTTGKQAFAELDKELPGSSARAQRIVDGMDAMDRILAKPNIPLSQNDTKLATSGFAQVAAQLFGASVGRELYRRFDIGGGIQTAAITSKYARQFMDRVTNKLNRQTAGNVLRDALANPDPTMLRDLLRPLDSQEAADRAASWIEREVNHAYKPLFLAAPTAIRANIEQAQEQTPNTQPNTAGMAGAETNRAPPLSGSVPVAGVR